MLSHLQQLASSCRLPKILNRLGLSTQEKISLFGTVTSMVTFSPYTTTNHSIGESCRTIDSRMTSSK
jgi:hypothetical protein